MSVPTREGSIAFTREIQSSVTGGAFSTPEVPGVYYAVAVLLGFEAFFSVGIPRIILLPLSAVIFISLAMKSVGSPLPAMMALIVYIPYAKAVSGNMGGAIPGLNYTTVLMLIVIMGMYSRSQGTHMEDPLPLERSFRKMVFLFCLLGAISVLHTDVVFAQWSIFTAIVDYKRWIDPFLVFFLFSYLIRTREEGKVIIYLMAVSMVIVGIGSLWEHHVIAGRSHRIRLKGIAGQANQMGAFYANYMFLILGFLTMKGIGSFKKSVFALGFWGCLLGLFATESRGDALALVGGMMLFFFLRSKLLFFGVVAGIAFLAINIQFLPSGLRARIQHTVTHRDQYGFANPDGQLDVSAQTRLALWSGAANMILHHPFMGVGYKMFPEYIFQYVPHNEETARLRLHHRDGHNAYLMIGAEMGIPTLLMFLLLLVFMIRIGLRSYRASRDPFWKTISISALCAILSLMMTNMFGSRVISLVLAGYLWALLAILLKVPKWEAEEQESGVAR
ncbi:MAG: O-antigen ligase family protein [Leptospirales bacterium]